MTNHPKCFDQKVKVCSTTIYKTNGKTSRRTSEIYGTTVDSKLAEP
jgi:hypothetical protein